MSAEVIARTLGMVIDVESDPHFAGAMWDGRRGNWKSLSESERLHEIAHWAVATDVQRRQPGFGLGNEPSSGSNFQRTVTAEAANSIEEYASALGISAEMALGMDWEATADDHGWDREQEFENLRDALEALGIYEDDCFGSGVAGAILLFETASITLSDQSA